MNRDPGVPGRRDRGLSLVELMIALVVVAFALLALFTLVTSSSQVQQETREKTLAYSAARKMIEEMRAATFAEIYARYNSVDDNLPAVAGQPNDTGAPGPSNLREPGPTFTVEGLNPVPGLAVGRILFAESGGGLSELGDASKGIPAKDLNRDGDAVDTGLTTYKILPVRVEVTWEGVGGKKTTIAVDTLITDK